MQIEHKARYPINLAKITRDKRGFFLGGLSCRMLEQGGNPILRATSQANKYSPSSSSSDRCAITSLLRSDNILLSAAITLCAFSSSFSYIECSGIKLFQLHQQNKGLVLGFPHCTHKNIHIAISRNTAQGLFGFVYAPGFCPLRPAVPA